MPLLCAFLLLWVVVMLFFLFHLTDPLLCSLLVLFFVLVCVCVCCFFPPLVIVPFPALIGSFLSAAVPVFSYRSCVSSVFFLLLLLPLLLQTSVDHLTSCYVTSSPSTASTMTLMTSLEACWRSARQATVCTFDVIDNHRT